MAEPSWCPGSRWVLLAARRGEGLVTAGAEEENEIPRESGRQGQGYLPRELEEGAEHLAALHASCETPATETRGEFPQGAQKPHSFPPGRGVGSTPCPHRHPGLSWEQDAALAPLIRAERCRELGQDARSWPQKSTPEPHGHLDAPPAPLISTNDPVH